MGPNLQYPYPYTTYPGYRNKKLRSSKTYCNAYRATISDPMASLTALRGFHQAEEMNPSCRATMEDSHRVLARRYDLVCIYFSIEQRTL